MKENIQWFFSGIGVEILKVLGGAIVGGITGYKIGINKKIIQNQKADNNAEQEQDAVIGIKREEDKKSNLNNMLIQSQKAGDGVKQIQTGRID
jgi:hypothetical protein